MNARPEAEDTHGYYFEGLSVCMSASNAETITGKDNVLSDGISGAINSVHLNAEFAT